jgi:hypothetical protein
VAPVVEWNKRRGSAGPRRVTSFSGRGMIAEEVKGGNPSALKEVRSRSGTRGAVKCPRPSEHVRWELDPSMARDLLVDPVADTRDRDRMVAQPRDQSCPPAVNQLRAGGADATVVGGDGGEGVPAVAIVTRGGDHPPATEQFSKPHQPRLVRLEDRLERVPGEVGRLFVL